LSLTFNSIVNASNEERAEHGHVVDGSVKACNKATVNVSTESLNALIDDGVGGSRRDQLLRGPRIIKLTTSCPPGRDHFATTGPWSLEWVKSQNLDIVGGNLPSAKHVPINSSSTSGQRVNKKKGSGYLRHTAQSMRRIARLLAKDREDVLCALKRNVKKTMRSYGDTQVQAISKDKVTQQSVSQSSVNNDWENWLVLHGTDRVAQEDVTGIGKEIGLKFGRDNNNMYDVLSSVRRKNKEGVGKGK